jgi:hypothetical protein
LPPVTVTRPLAETQHGVLARDRLRGAVAEDPAAPPRPHQRAQAHPGRAHVGAHGRTREHAGGLAEDEVHLRGQRFGLGAAIRARRVGGAQHGLAQPRHGKEHAAVARARHEQRLGAGQEGTVHHQVHALARGDQGCGAPPADARRGVHRAHAVDPHARGVDHAGRAHLEGFAGSSSRARTPRRGASPAAPVLPAVPVVQQPVHAARG